MNDAGAGGLLAGGLGLLVMLVVVVIWLVWAILWFMVPFHIAQIRKNLDVLVLAARRQDAALSALAPGDPRAQRASEYEAKARAVLAAKKDDPGAGG